MQTKWKAQSKQYMILEATGYEGKPYTGPSAWELISHPPFSIMKDLPSYAQRFPWKAPAHKFPSTKPAYHFPSFKPLTWLAAGAAQDGDVRPVLSYGHALSIYGQRAMVSADSYRAHIMWTGADEHDDVLYFKKSFSDTFEGKYPDVAAVMPNSTCGITVHARDLYMAVKRAMVFARDSANSVNITYFPPTSPLEASRLEVTGRSMERGDCTTAVDCSSDIRERYQWSADGRYIMDALIPWLAGDGRADLHVHKSNAIFLIGEPYEYLAAIMPLLPTTGTSMGDRTVYTAEGSHSLGALNPNQPNQPRTERPIPIEPEVYTQVVGEVDGIKIVVRIA